MHSKELSALIDQLSRVFDNDPWYGNSIHSILQSVESELVFDPPAPSVHSIAELVAHMITWREFAESRVRGGNDFLPDQEESFNWQKRFPARQYAWKLLHEKLAASNRELISLLRHSDERLLDQGVAGKPYSFRYLLNGIIQHDLYHIGQISLIHKMQQQRHQIKLGILGYSYRIFPYQYLSSQK